MNMGCSYHETSVFILSLLVLFITMKEKVYFYLSYTVKSMSDFVLSFKAKACNGINARLC